MPHHAEPGAIPENLSLKESGKVLGHQQHRINAEGRACQRKYASQCLQAPGILLVTRGSGKGQTQKIGANKGARILIDPL